MRIKLPAAAVGATALICGIAIQEAGNIPALPLRVSSDVGVAGSQLPSPAYQSNYHLSSGRRHSRL